MLYRAAVRALRDIQGGSKWFPPTQAWKEAPRHLVDSGGEDVQAAGFMDTGLNGQPCRQAAGIRGAGGSEEDGVDTGLDSQPCRHAAGIRGAEGREEDRGRSAAETRAQEVGDTAGVGKAMWM